MVLIAIFFLIFLKKDVKWLLNTNPLIGTIILLIMVLPWFFSLSAAGAKQLFQRRI